MVTALQYPGSIMFYDSLVLHYVGFFLRISATYDTDTIVKNYRIGVQVVFSLKSCSKKGK